MAKEKELVFEISETGCKQCTSHALNADGYLRKWIPAKKRMMMYHRYIWEEVNGPVPEGYEIDHICRNRNCCNPDHLRCIPRTEHIGYTNRYRYAGRKQKAYEYWLENPTVLGRELGEFFGVSFSSGCKWKREWKKL